MKNRRFIAFMLALLVCTSTALLSCSSDKDGSVDSETDSAAADTVEQGLPVGDETEAETAPPVVLPAETEAADTELPSAPTEEDPSQDIPAVEMPETEEPAAEETRTPTEEQGALWGLAGQTDSGRFASAQSEKLVLCIDWSSVIDDNGTAEVTVTVGISHYRLFSREKFEMGAIQVDGNAVLFSTPAIEYDENTKTFTTFYTATYTTERSEMEVEASWQVLGKYGDVEIDTLTAGGTIVLAEDS